MSDFKSKLPDLKELASMTSKLFYALKGGVTEIVEDYKKKREHLGEPEAQKTEAASSDVTESETEIAEKKVTKKEPKSEA